MKEGFINVICGQREKIYSEYIHIQCEKVVVVFILTCLQRD